ncbi:DUF1496 domain-containing protein [Vibrio genomosp. F10]|uniref:DUF1496 domain-containing protein n=1 Tax=Vibrio genomosp. F10 TaxID=723171 RepID=A0A1B9R1J0_9VIBR|nr:DUF1496 domain-containing protein [Vibrio genomosp. F10]OCH77914.1 hypothetical protein A6E14_06865 [Vibrio genomosp. F10]OEE97802.1 hypothetical protein A1QK_12780 [Vibrio genomosp. F10 str. 9ZD137]
MIKYQLITLTSIVSMTSIVAMIAPPLNAKVISTPGKSIIAVDGSSAAKRVCYYQDQAYSLGAILQVGEHYMICKEANDFETNGALKWVQLKSSSQDN